MTSAGAISKPSTPSSWQVANKGVLAAPDRFALYSRLASNLRAGGEASAAGGGAAAAACHIARSTVRRAERRVLSLRIVESIRNETLEYLNRLSDLLFVIARVLARTQLGQEVLWDRRRTEE